MKLPVVAIALFASSCAIAGAYATGGEVSLNIVGADTYAVHVFTNNGEFVVKGAGLDAAAPPPPPNAVSTSSDATANVESPPLPPSELTVVEPCPPAPTTTP